MSFLYRYPAPDYREHMNKEGPQRNTNIVAKMNKALAPSR